MTAPVVVDSGARAAWGFLPVTAPPGTIWQGSTGEMVVITATGAADAILQGGAPWHRSIASAPDARRAP